MRHEENDSRGDTGETACGSYIDYPTGCHREDDCHGVNEKTLTVRESCANSGNATDRGTKKLIARGRLGCTKFRLYHEHVVAPAVDAIQCASSSARSAAELNLPEADWIRIFGSLHER